MNYKDEYNKLLEDGYKFYSIEDFVITVMFGNDKSDLVNQYNELFQAEVGIENLVEISDDYIKYLFNYYPELINQQGLLLDGAPIEEIVVKTINNVYEYDVIFVD